MTENENIHKVSKFFNEIFDNQIKKYLVIANENSSLPKESIIFLNSTNNSISNSIDLINNDEYIDSLCLLRSSFEAIIFSLAIFFDKKTYEVYKHYDTNTYRKSLLEKYKKQKQKNPKFKIPDIDKKYKDLLKPEIMRGIVAENYTKVFAELFANCKNAEEVKSEFRDFYKYLCNFTHPSIVKTYTFKIQNDSDNLDSIRAVFKLNINYCKILLLLSLNFFTLKDDMRDIYDLYAILFLSDVNLITNVDNLKTLLKKYDEYLYLNITRKYFENNDKKIKEIQKELKEINEVVNLNEKFVGIIKNIVIKFDSLEIFNEYFRCDFRREEL